MATTPDRVADTSHKWWNRPFGALGGTLRGFARSAWDTIKGGARKIRNGEILGGLADILIRGSVGTVGFIVKAAVIGVIGGISASVVKCVKGGMIDGAWQAFTGKNLVTGMPASPWAGAAKFLGGAIGLGVVAITTATGIGAAVGAVAGAVAGGATAGAAAGAAAGATIIPGATAVAGAAAAGASAVAGLATAGASAVAGAVAAVPGLATAGASAAAGAWATSTAAVGSTLGVSAVGAAVVTGIAGTACVVAGGVVGARITSAIISTARKGRSDLPRGQEEQRKNTQASSSGQQQEDIKALNASAQSQSKNSDTPYQQNPPPGFRTTQNIAATSPPNTEIFKYVWDKHQEINNTFREKGNLGELKINQKNNSFSIVGRDPIAALGSLPNGDALRNVSYTLSLPPGTGKGAIERHLEASSKHGIRIENIKIGNQTFPVKDGKIVRDTPAQAASTVDKDRDDKHARPS